MQDEVRYIYKDLQTSLIKLIPEKWDSICLYASVLEDRKGEMYFYYFPKRFIKSKPINCYEIASRFGIDEKVYNEEIAKIYVKIKRLKSLTKGRWTNVTLIIDKNLFTLEYHYNDLYKSIYTDEQRRIIWCYKYLHIPLESLNKKEQELVTHYREETNIRPTIFIEDAKHLEEVKIVRNQILKC